MLLVVVAVLAALVAGVVLLGVVGPAVERVVLRLRFPREITPEQVVAFLSSLPAPRRGQLVLPPPLVFEAVATSEGVTHTLTVAASDRDTIVAQLQAALPGIRLEPLDAASSAVPLWAVTLRGRSRIHPLASARTEPRRPRRWPAFNRWLRVRWSGCSGWSSVRGCRRCRIGRSPVVAGRIVMVWLMWMS